MKKAALVLMIGLFIGGLMVSQTACGGDSTPAKGVKPAVKTSFDEVTSKLDGGGSFYLYFSTEKLVNIVDEFANKLRKLIEDETAKKETQEKDGLKIFDFIYGMIKKCGLMEISGVGMSSVPIEKDLNHSKTVLHRYKDKGNGLIWQFMEPAPHDQPELKLLPADTVLGGFSDFKPNVLWEWVKKQAEASNLPKVKQAIQSVEPMLQTQGIQLTQLLNSLNGRMGLILVLDSSKKTALPMANTMIEIPEPSIAVAIAVKDDYLFNLLQSKLPFAKKSDDPGVKKLEIPVPKMPFLFQPVILQKEGLLIVASNNQVVDAMFAAKENGNGLIATDEFKRLSANMPDKGNAFRYLGSRLFQTLKDMQDQILEKTGKDEDKAAMELLGIFQKEWVAYGITQNTDEGYVYISNHSMSMANLVASLAAAPVGIIAAVAIPNILTATQKGKQKATMGDMKTVGMAIESYMTDHYQAPPGKTLTEIKSKLEPFYIKRLPLKDGWGNDFHYYHGTGDKKDEYGIGSGGKDGVFNGWNQTGVYIVTEIKLFGNDIIFSNGTFTYGPKVK
jgi:general secretion pathway protein G